MPTLSAWKARALWASSRMTSCSVDWPSCYASRGALPDRGAATAPVPLLRHRSDRGAVPNTQLGLDRVECPGLTRASDAASAGWRPEWVGAGVAATPESAQGISPRCPRSPVGLGRSLWSRSPPVATGSSSRSAPICATSSSGSLRAPNTRNRPDERSPGASRSLLERPENPTPKPEIPVSQPWAPTRAGLHPQILLKSPKAY